MSGSVVVDASLAIKWLVEEDDSDKAQAILQSWVAQDVTRIAPYLMPFEVANALHRRVLRGELNVSQSALLRSLLLDSRLELHHSSSMHVRAMQLAGELRQGAAYDAHYLALAESLDCGVVDRRPAVLPSRKRSHRQRALDRGARRTGVVREPSTSCQPKAIVGCHTRRKDEGSLQLAKLFPAR